jgi:protein-S-isoprenylcysteine O-methyltransferase Ste14
VKSRIGKTIKQLDQRGHRLFYNVISVVTFLPVLLIVAKMPGRLIYQLFGPWQIIALTLQILSLAGIVLILRLTDLVDFLVIKQWTGKTSSQSSKLVTDDPYQRVRHPLYTLGLLFIWLTPVLTTGILMFNLGLSEYLCRQRF